MASSNTTVILGNEEMTTFKTYVGKLEDSIGYLSRYIGNANKNLGEAVAKKFSGNDFGKKSMSDLTELMAIFGDLQTSLEELKLASKDYISRVEAISKVK